MGIFPRLAGVFATAILLLSGCSKPTPPPGSAVEQIDASKLRPAFASAPAPIQAKIDQVMVELQSSNPARALAILKSVAAEPDLTPDQKKTADAVADQLSKKVGGQPGT